MALMPVADALRQILGAAARLGAEEVDLAHALGRTLAEPIVARADNPPFDASAMDGYALRAADIATTPTSLRLIGQSGAGHPFGGEVGNGETVRIFTGAPVPRGADTVVIQENVTAAGATITVREPAQRNANIRLRGEDFAKEETLLLAGRRLTARDILIAASSGYAKLSVVCKPVVAILSTGDELVLPGAPLGPGQIAASNTYGLAAVVEAAGGEARILGIAGDSLAALAQAIGTADGADVLVTSGGASVGDHDLVRPALEAAGAKLDFYKIAMRPGKPLFFGARNASGTRQLCLGLPGNPVSSLICARVFLVPLIGQMLGRKMPFETFNAILAEPIAANGPREHYMRAVLDSTTSPPRVTPFGNQDSGLIKVLQRADCLIKVAPDAPAQTEGSTVSVLKLDI